MSDSVTELFFEELPGNLSSIDVYSDEFPETDD